MEYDQTHLSNRETQSRVKNMGDDSKIRKSKKSSQSSTRRAKSVLDLELQTFRSEDAQISRSILQNILESSIEYSIVGTDLEGTILVWNEGARLNYGYQAQEMINKQNIIILHKPGDIESGVAQEFMNQALQKGKAEQEFERIRKDGTFFIASVTLTVRKNDEGKPIGYVMISKNITEAKRIEDELIRSNQELEQFAYIASHDLKAPLRAIQRLACWIEEDNIGNLDEKSMENLSLLRQRTIRMANLIDGILHYSRAGRVDLNVERVKTKDILKDIIENLDPDVNFKFHLPDFFPVFKTSKIQLIQVLSNLIGNSIKHHHQQKGKIKIDIKPLGTFYLFSIKDNGPGIDSAYFDKIFIIFQTLKSRDEFEATGIGLSIVKKIVESQGGKITIQSKVGKGTTISFTWPKTVKISSESKD